MELSAPPNTNEISEAETENERRLEIVTVHPVVASINRILQQPVSSYNKDVTIYKVPEPLRSINPEAYTPTAISIGPFHYCRKDLMANSLKPMYLRHFLNLAHLSVNTIVETVQTLEQRARCCYTESIEMSRDEFVELLVLDACFVVMHLLRFWSKNFVTPNTSNLWQFRNAISRDLMLLENQLPFFLLQSLYHLFPPSQPSLKDVSFIEIVRRYFSIHNNPGFYFIDIKLLSADNVNHFVDLVRMRNIRTTYSHEKSNEYLFWPPNATELHECGVIFRTGNGIEFNDTGGCLQLPPIKIYDDFEKRVRNLIAYEQCHIVNRSMKSVTNFAVFMQCLVQTDQDVKLLIEGGIIENNLGSIKEVTQLFNDLSKHIYIGINYYNSDCKKMKEYCKLRRHRWMTSLRRNYFSTPWHCASSIAAILLLGLTLIQTILAVLTGFKQTS